MIRIALAILVLVLLSLSQGCAFARDLAMEARDAAIPVAQAAAKAAMQEAGQQIADRLEGKLALMGLGIDQRMNALGTGIEQRVGAALTDLRSGASETKAAAIEGMRSWAELNKPKPGEAPSDTQELIAMALLAALGGGAAVKGVEKVGGALVNKRAQALAAAGAVAATAAAHAPSSMT